MASDANLVVPGPCHPGDATGTQICQLSEGAGKRIPSACLEVEGEKASGPWGEIQVRFGTPCAAVGNGGSDALALVCQGRLSKKRQDVTIGSVQVAMIFVLQAGLVFTPLYPLLGKNELHGRLGGSKHDEAYG